VSEPTSLRDEFAKAALPVVVQMLAMLTSRSVTYFDVTSRSRVIDEQAIAESAYALADAMMKERAKVTT
jgi:hypothetical protein